MSSGRGKRRVKGKTIDLSSFLGDQNTPTGFAVVTPRRDWADCVEEENDDRFPTYRKDEKIVLPTAPKAARGPDFDVSKIPSQPPFTAFVGNLPYDIMDEDIMRFFGNLKVISVRLPRDGGDRGRMRGFGYAEFEDKQSLIEALSLNGETLKNRPIKVSLAGEHENERGDRKNDGIDRTAGDWRAAPKEDSFGSRSDRQRNGAFGSRYDDGDREPYRGRSSFDNDRSRNYEDGDRQPYQGRRSYEREREYGFGRDRDRYNRDGDQGFSDRDRGYNRRYGERGFDSYERDRGYDRGARSGRRDDDFEPRREDDRDREPPKERPRLQLKPRTAAVEQPAVAPVQTSSIFGGAKPVDTAAKEREIEKRLAKEKEKHDDLDKPRFSQSQSGRYTSARGVPEDKPPSSRRDWDKKSDSESREDYRRSDYSPPRRYADESYSRDARSDHDDSEGGERESGIHKYSKDDIQSSAVEQQDEQVSFLANKFAHLSNQEELID